MKDLSATLTLPIMAADSGQEAAAETSTISQGDLKITARQLQFFYGEHQALFDNNLDIARNRVTAIIGPSGCGKSTHLRVYNRIYRALPGPAGQRRGPAGRRQHPQPGLRSSWNCAARWA